MYMLNIYLPCLQCKGRGKYFIIFPIDNAMPA